MLTSIYLNGIYIMGNDDQLCLLFLNQRGDVINSLTNNERPLGGGISLSGSASLGAGTKPLLLGLLALRAVLVQQFEQLSRCQSTTINVK